LRWSSAAVQFLGAHTGWLCAGTTEKIVAPAKSKTAEDDVRNISTPSPPHVAVTFLRFESGRLQPFANLARNHDRAMMPAGAAEGDRQIALPFADVVRNQVNQQF